MNQNYDNFPSFLLTILTTGLITVSACNNDNRNEPNPSTTSSTTGISSGTTAGSTGGTTSGTSTTTSTNSLTAKLFTSSFSSDTLLAGLKDISGQEFIHLKYKGQSVLGGDTLWLSIKSSAETGEEFLYDQTNGSNTLQFYLGYTNPPLYYSPKSGNIGKLIVSVHDKPSRVIKGTFYGTVTSQGFSSHTYNITEGVFEAKY